MNPSSVRKDIAQHLLTSTLQNAGALLHSMGEHQEAMAKYKQAINVEIKATCPTSHQTPELTKKLYQIARKEEEELKRRADVQGSYLSGIAPGADTCVHNHGSHSRTIEMFRTNEAFGNKVDFMERKCYQIFSEPLLISSLSSYIKIDYDSSTFLHSVILYNMALLHNEAGSLNAAITLLDMIDIDSVHNAALCLLVLNLTGKLHFREGRLDKALESFQTALDRGNSFSCYDTSSFQSTRFDQQLGLKENIPETVNGTISFYHKCIATSLSNISRIFFLQNRLAEAINLCQQTISLFTHVTHPSATHDFDTAVTMYNIGLVSLHMGDLQTALSHCKFFLDHYSDDKDELHPLVASAFQTMGIIHLEKKQYELAVNYLEKSAIAIRNVFGKRDWDIHRTYYFLGKAYFAIDQGKNVMKWFNRALTIARENHGSFHEDVVIILYEIGQVQMKKGLIHAAQATYEELLLVSQTLFGARSCHTANILEILGTINMERGEIDDAISNFRAAYRISMEIQNEASSEHPQPAGLDLIRTLCAESEPAAPAA